MNKTPATGHLLAHLDHQLRIAQDQGAAGCMIDREVVGALAEILRSLLNPPPRRDPFFADADVVGLFSQLAIIQLQLRPTRAALRQTPARLAALGHVAELADSDEEIRATWRWFLLEQPDEFKGRWIDTFFEKYASYVEQATSAPSPDAGKFRLPKVADEAAALMRRADNAGLEGGE